MAKRISDPETRFWPKVDKSGDCWVWTAALDRRGYGRFGLPGRSGWTLAHRWSYAHNVGPIPAGQFVCHHCDNRACVRPEHLFLGDHVENMTDMIRKGRSNAGPRNKMARLDDETVRHARQLRAQGMTYAQIGRQLDVPMQTIWRAASGRGWKHVPADPAQPLGVAG